MRFMKMWSTIIPAAGVVAMLAATGSVGQPMSGMSGDTAKPAVHAKKLKPQSTCPVTGDPIDKKLYVDYKGKRIYVCCSMCIDSVKKDPEKYIKKLERMGQSVETIIDNSKKKGNNVKADTSMKGMNMTGMEMAGDTASKVTETGYWTCPMHPEIHKTGPGQCPICGMNLVFKATGTKKKNTEVKADTSMDKMKM